MPTHCFRQMEERKEYLHYHSMGEQMPCTQQMTAQYYPRVTKKKGRWSNQEHHIFITCLKKYGKDWDRLEELIPTRSGLQIRSHCQKYLDQIKKEYNTNNPLECILKNMCDTSPYYQFDLPQLTDPVQNPEIQRMMAQREEAPAKEKVDSRSQCIQQSKNMAESDSSGYFEREDLSRMKKRDLKALLRIVQDSDSSNLSKEKRLMKESNSDSSDNLFKIEKVSRSREESLSNSNPNPNKSSQQKSVDTIEIKDQEAKMKIKQACSVVLLNNGKVIIQGDRIESRVPSDIQKYGGNFSIVTPNYPCQVFIEPLVLSKRDSQGQTDQEMAHIINRHNFNGKGCSPSHLCGSSYKNSNLCLAEYEDSSKAECLRYFGAVTQNISFKDEIKKPLTTCESYSTNARSSRTCQQTLAYRDEGFMKEMEILLSIFCNCVKQ